MKEGKALKRMADNVLLQASGLKKSYGEEVIFHDVSLSLDRGKSMSITSASGSGKSTILAIIGLILMPDTGIVAIDGQNAYELDDAARAVIRQRKIGFVFQHTQLIGSLRAWENVAVPARFCKDPGFDVEERSRKLLCDLGLEERLDHFPYQLSVGQKRRVAVARALIMHPDLVIADEPTNDLDAPTADTVASMLFEQVDEGKGLVLVTHDMELANKTGHRYELRDKELVQLR